MNRETKLRAWDKDQKRFRSDLVRDEQGRVWCWNHFVRGYATEMNPQCFEWVESTGLSDKNGREIYEGDIVTAPNYSYDPSNGDSPVNIDTIEFRDASFRLKEQCDPIDEDECSENVEVIGNIYENPDLLA